MKDSVPDTLVKQKDIVNARQKLRLDALDSRTPIQALLHILQEYNIKYRVKLSDSESCLLGLVWIYP